MVHVGRRLHWTVVRAVLVFPINYSLAGSPVTSGPHVSYLSLRRHDLPIVLTKGTTCECARLICTSTIPYPS
ncbi:hypothetical protein BD311DRAFT_768029 [Dichomitus squalens]|uniref:Secreted protein n=1 Tax=Dichomitus squalens TaxID=114155 RepID=A0A4Q9M9H5_9APHY|nr:hypothetical protein BD311DRAFT_768029 [Dichomitus squalens]